MQTETIVDDEFLNPAPASLAGLAPWQIDRLRAMSRARAEWLARGGDDEPSALPTVHSVIAARRERDELFNFLSDAYSAMRSRPIVVGRYRSSRGHRDFAGG